MNFDFNDWGSWGVCDDKYCLYDEGAALQEALESGENFDTGWHGFKKELESLRVERDDDNVIVSVAAYMDSVYEQPELMFDCLNDEEDALLGNDDAALDAFIDRVRDGLMFTDFVEETEESATLPREASLDDVLKAATVMMRMCHQTLNDSFRLCIVESMCALYENTLSPDELVALIDKRIAELAPYEND